MHTIGFDGLGRPDGRYTVVIGATGLDGVTVSQQLELAVSRTLGPASLEPSVFTPNGDGTGDALTVSFELAAPASVRLRVLRDGAWVATPFTGPLPAGAQTVGWDGVKRVGRARDGSYTAVLDVTDTIGTSEVSLPFQMDAHPPTIKLLGASGADLGLGSGRRDSEGQRRAPAPRRTSGRSSSPERDPQGADDRRRRPRHGGEQGRLPPPDMECGVSQRWTEGVCGTPH